MPFRRPSLASKLTKVHNEALTEGNWDEATAEADLAEAEVAREMAP